MTPYQKCRPTYQIVDYHVGDPTKKTDRKNLMRTMRYRCQSESLDVFSHCKMFENGHKPNKVDLYSLLE